MSHYVLGPGAAHATITVGAYHLASKLRVSTTQVSYTVGASWALISLHIAKSNATHIL